LPPKNGALVRAKFCETQINIHGERLERAALFFLGLSPGGVVICDRVDCRGGGRAVSMGVSAQGGAVWERGL